jgi:predicted ATPase/DNA-binding CsgD family transcriptional regulator
MTKRYETLKRARSDPLIGSYSPSAPIVGRQRELTLVMKQYEAVKKGHSRVVLLTGEPGMGKTRLLKDFSSQIAQNGAIVLRGNATESEGMPPFLPFLEALGRYIRVNPQDQLRSKVALVPQILASLLPELSVYFPDHLDSLPVPPEQARFRLYEAIGTFLEVISGQHVLVLILDDLHWADTASLDLMLHLAYYQSNRHLLILGAYRENEVDGNPALARTLAELSRQRVLTTVVVDPLSATEIGMLAFGRHGGTLSKSVNVLLHAQSEGNPFFAEELLDDWIECGAIKQENDQWVAVAPLGHALPPTIAGAIRQRFTRLAPAVIDHLRVAAIIGRSFDLSLLAMVEEQKIEDVEEQLQEAVRARLIQNNQLGYYFFGHDKIRECLYMEVSASRRRRLHELIGNVLETHSGQAHPMGMYQLTELAFHFAHSSNRTQGVKYSLLAATRALQTGAIEEAMSHYRTSLELLEPDDRRRGNILLDLGEAALLVGEDQQAETIYETAQRWYLLYAQEAEDEVCLARAAHGLGLALWRQEKRQEAYEALENALAYFGNRECAERVKILVDLSQLLMVYMGKHDEGMAFAQQAMEIAHRLQVTELEEIARRIIVGNLSLHGGELSLAVQALQQMLSHAEEGGDLAEAGECCLNLAVGTYWLAEVRRSYKVSMHRITLIERSKQPYQLRTAYTWPVLLLASQGKWAEAEKEVARARSIVEHLPSSMPYAFLRQFQGFLAYQQEKYSLAERELEVAWALESQNLQGGLGEIAFYFGLLGLVQATVGKRVEALAYSKQLERFLELLPEGILPTAPMMVCLALTAVKLGDPKRATSLYTPLLSFRGQHYWFLVDRLLGLLASMNGEWARAAIHLEEAETIAQREGLQPELARTYLEQANIVLGQGDQKSIPQAIGLLKNALVLFESLGMVDSGQQVSHRLQSLSHYLSDTIYPSPLPANLTQREAEVLRLVSCGKSNSLIAQELVISEKTVINHLTHIFNKTNCVNRAAATAFAIRHGLA